LNPNFASDNVLGAFDPVGEYIIVGLPFIVADGSPGSFWLLALRLSST
jgi:hypothetical protein